MNTDSEGGFAGGSFAPPGAHFAPALRAGCGFAARVKPRLAVARPAASEIMNRDFHPCSPVSIRGFTAPFQQSSNQLNFCGGAVSLPTTLRNLSSSEPARRNSAIVP